MKTTSGIELKFIKELVQISSESLCYRFVLEDKQNWIPKNRTLGKLQRQHCHIQWNTLQNFKKYIFLFINFNYYLRQPQDAKD